MGPSTRARVRRARDGAHPAAGPQRRHGAVGGNHPRRKRSILAARQGRLPAGGVARTPPAGRFSPAAWAPGAHSLLDFTYHLPGIHILELNKAARRRGGGARGPKSLLWRNFREEFRRLYMYTCFVGILLWSGHRRRRRGRSSSSSSRRRSSNVMAVV